ncbi:hypothetical protein DFR52_102231 [Hoeflea marina]|uniref:Uncharacterized protein n=1 Tax=Hoeflea marina TaxID=274592 RepID=A0A317PNE3_9HYPH|nr:hypothetical protein [Hoeflea marina]PWW01568.1 hypothetical protein DFR52_102231 [Hoeflea marina]
MPYRNRVDPGGDLHAVSDRGMLFGNRGCIHNARGEITRKPPVDRWIICLTEFKGWRRRLLQPGQYTELFFLDELTALAAGHRPCFLCRREDANQFRVAMASVRGVAHLSADEIDRILKPERALPADDPRRRISLLDIGALPDGAMLRQDGQYLLKLGGALLPWSFGGYGAGRPLDAMDAAPLWLVTPPSSVAVLKAGYAPLFHPSVKQPTA